MATMNKQLESLLQRATAWPEEAQDEAVRALTAIEEKHLPQTNEAEREAKLQALRETIERSIARGGSYTDEEIEASIAARLDAWERERNGR
jgi:hypothetical protein